VLLDYQTINTSQSNYTFKADTTYYLHSFSQDHLWFSDYETFVGLLGANGAVNSLSFGRNINGIELYCGWVTGNPIFLKA